MKNTLLKLSLAAAFAAFASSASAQTTFSGGDYGTAGNWSLGLPSLVQSGTVSVNGTMPSNTTYTNFVVTQTAGILSNTGATGPITFSGGSFTQNGGVLGNSNQAGRGFTFTGGNLTTLTSGTIYGGDKDSTSINAGTLLINNGSYLLAGTRGVSLTNSGTLTINGGALSTSTISGNFFGVNNLAAGSNLINLNGGTTSVNLLAFGNNVVTPRLRLTLGGTTVGSFTAVNFQTLSGTEVIGARRIDWLSGTKMTMTISNADEWAAAEWAANRMFFNGQSGSTLGRTWAQAIDPGTGLGGGNYFVYNSTTETLSLAVPEPTTWALLTVGLTAVMAFRRRRLS